MERQGFIYILICLVTGKGYVGQTIKPRVEMRWLQHIKSAFVLNNKRPLYCAMRKYKLKNFVGAVVWTGLESELNNAEKRFIRKHNTFIDNGCGYNLTTGGDSYKLSKAAVRKLRKGVIAAYANDPTLAVRIGNANRGKKRSKETKTLLSELATVQFSTVRGRKKAVRAGKKRFESLEERKKMSVITTARMRVLTNRVALSIATTKQFASKEARVAASQRTKARYKRRPELRKLVGDDSRKRWASKSGRKKIMDALKPIWASEEHSKRCSEAQKKRFAKPGERAKASASKKAAWAVLPEWRKEEIRKAKCVAANTPESLERQRQAQLKRYANHPVTDEERAAMSVITTAYWARRRQEATVAKNSSK